jgi:hypothetical protein
MYLFRDVEEGADKRILFPFPYCKVTIYSNICNWPFKYVPFSPAFTEIHQEVLDLKRLNCRHSDEQELKLS